MKGHLVSVWGLDAEGNLKAAQRFVHTELKDYTIAPKVKNKLTIPGRKIAKEAGKQYCTTMLMQECLITLKQDSGLNNYRNRFEQELLS